VKERVSGNSEFHSEPTNIIRENCLAKSHSEVGLFLNAESTSGVIDVTN
jgi:hypothetical protein